MKKIIKMPKQNKLLKVGLIGERGEGMSLALHKIAIKDYGFVLPKRRSK